MRPIIPTDHRAQIKQHADALAGLKTTEPPWLALVGRIELAIADANDYSTHPDTDEDKRPGWAGRERGLRDLLQELVELQNGEYKQWPEMRGAEAGKAGKRESEEGE